MLIFTATGYGVARADGRAFLPAVSVRSPAWQEAAPRPTLPAHTWSSLLADVPLPPAARLTFFEVRPDTTPPAATAWYEVAASGSEIGAWYLGFLPLFGWMLQSDGGNVQHWSRLGEWLTITCPRAAAGPVTLRLARDPAHVRSAGGHALAPDVPLPSAARRWRYDPVDFLAEEVRLGLPLEVARDVMSGLLRAEDWVPTTIARLGEADLVGYRRDDRTLMVAFSEVADAETEIALGTRVCPVPPPPGGTVAERAASVYLEGVPAPPGAEIVAFDRAADVGMATERWRASCHDLDLQATALRSRLTPAHWEVAPDALRRTPGALELLVRPVDDTPPVSCTLRSMGETAVHVDLQRESTGCRTPAGRSLLFDDLPVPAGASASRLVTGGDWAFEEVYEIRGATASPASWYRDAMRALGWRFDRLEPPAQGPHQVYYAGGEEVAVSIQTGVTPTVTLARRRVCARDEPVPPTGPPATARHMADMPVYPGAAFEAFSGTEESYRVTCAGLDVLAGWFRATMERGDWALAGTVGPEDRFARQLLFVRPDEKALPPELRSAWAEVRLERPWPYQDRIVLRRDPGGITPGPLP